MTTRPDPNASFLSGASRVSGAQEANVAPHACFGEMRLGPPLLPAPYPRLRRPRPLFLTLVCAGFPSPADDHQERVIDLNEELIGEECATFFFKVIGQSAEGDFVRNGDIIVVDRSLKPRHGDEVLVVLDGERCVKRLCQRGERTWLESATPGYPVIEVSLERELCIEGVVTWSLHQIRRR